jgi:hypothetical protein
MLKKIGQFLNYCTTYFFPFEGQVFEVQQKDDYYKLVEQARREWQDARLRFEQISDPDLIDHAIYSIEAAEQRYMYLLKKAKDEKELKTVHSPSFDKSI